MKRKYIVVYTTFPNERTAKKIVDALVRSKHAACGSIFKLYSIYRWKGKLERTPEYGAFIKTRASRYHSVEKYIKDNHPYDVPEIISWDITLGQCEYLNWVYEVTDSAQK
ncbi:MAG: divalent-cation tolerance protein CutA [candidate division WOR-3 bacterium]|nr:MAG: divalent-cation tolerance protein CutA [candidate division WOR-3 bacterium]